MGTQMYNLSRQQLLDSLTSHISLYHSKSPPSPSNHPNPNPRSAVIKWFSSLSVAQRQAYLTIVDPKFARILLQMLFKLRSLGPTSFLILPDIPATASSSASTLPTLCHRRTHGLLSRAHESNEFQRSIRASTLLFDSKEGEKEAECLVDSVTVSQELVTNVDRFVEVMDGVSGGAFLRGDESCNLGDDWLELSWLKAKGYYSIEEFITNRLEVALRLAWLSNGCNSVIARKKGGLLKLKEKVGVAANVFWRKKGCLDWWTKLDDGIKRKIFRTLLGQAAKSLTSKMLKRTNNVREDQSWLSSSKPWRYDSTLSGKKRNIVIGERRAKVEWTRIPTSGSGNLSPLDHIYDGLCILQDISSMISELQHNGYDEEKLLFSSLDSLDTTCDFVLRKLRGLLMVVSLDCTRFELLDDRSSNPSPKKYNEKLVANNHKKKGKSRSARKAKSVPSLSASDLTLCNPGKDDGNSLVCRDDVNTGQSNTMMKIEETDLAAETPACAAEMGRGEGFNNGHGRSAPKKKRKARNKLKKTNLSSSAGVSISMNSHEGRHGPVEMDRENENPILGKVPNDVALRDDCLGPSSSCSSPVMMDIYASDTRTCGCVSVQCSCRDGSSFCENNDKVIAYEKPASTMQTMDQDLQSVSCSVIPVECNIPHIVETVSGDYQPRGEKETKSSFQGQHTKAYDPVQRMIPVQEQGGVGAYRVCAAVPSAYPSYEWPSIAPLNLPSASSHVPAAADRLHLDVGHNRQNHLHQSLVQTVHQVRNSPMENTCNGLVPRPLPMSLDWPPILRGVNRLAPSVTCNYDSGFISRRQSCLQQDFTCQGGLPGSTITSDDERVYSSDLIEYSDVTNSQELADEHDSHWMSEEELEIHAVPGVDYSQYFGGGVMYWNSSDLQGNSFSRPPSLSSDDSSWAWREADMNRAVDDMVAFSSSYSTNGLASPSAASFCSPFDPLVSGHQALGYVIPGSEISGKVLHSSASMTDTVLEDNVSGSLSNLSIDNEAKSVDSLPYPILRPIIIPNLSRERSRSDFRRGHDHKSPCVPHNRREQPRIKRPPSPVVLCVPRAPRPPPPSPVGDSRKHRGFPTVRSGSSSPRHWGVKGWFHDGVNFEEACMRMDGSEVVLPSWRSKSFSTRQLAQPLPGSLLQDRLIAITQLARDQEHPDVTFPLQPPESVNCTMHKESLPLIHNLLHDEIDSFCKQVAAENLIRKPYINWAVKRVTRSLQVLWPRSRTNIFGSNATGLSLPSSDVDLVVCLPPVRNLEPIKEAGILEGRNGIKETCLQHAARYLANQEWVKNDSLKIVENTAIPIIMLVVEVPHDLIASTLSNISTTKEDYVPESGEQVSLQNNSTGSESSISPKWTRTGDDVGKNVKSVRLDISFKSPSHTGLQTTELVKQLTEQFPAATPLALVLKQFLADRSLDQSYSGGLSSYCLVLLIIRFLQHEHHQGRPINQNYGSLLMDFLYFFGNVFDPRQMRISVQGSGLYIKRERGYSIDPIYIDDPLFPANNVGRNCFRIHQCIKAFADAYSILEKDLTCLSTNDDSNTVPPCKLLPKIVPNIANLEVS